MEAKSVRNIYLRAILQLQINILPSCITLVLFIYINLWCTETQTNKKRRDKSNDFELIVQLLDKFFAVLSLGKQKFPCVISVYLSPILEAHTTIRQQYWFVTLREEHFTTILWCAWKMGNEHLTRTFQRGYSTVWQTAQKQIKAKRNAF